MDGALYAVNTAYNTSDDDERILEVMADEPAGRVNPYLLREATGLSKQRVSNALRQLVAAGWVRKETRGLYDLVDEARAEIEATESDQHPQSDDLDVRAVAELLSDWTPDTQASAEYARTETARALEWLRRQEGRQSKRDFVEAVAFDESVDHWWGRAVQPGLRQLAEHGVVEYRPGHHDYKMVD